jgi:RimJ/RimL family protein N-acetyltransferase
MQKVGMKFEGRSPEAFKKWGEFLDIDRYGILHSQWNQPPGASDAG